MTTRPRRGAKPEAIVEGRPALVLREEDREAVADALADLLLADLLAEETRTERRR